MRSYNFFQVIFIPRQNKDGSQNFSDSIEGTTFYSIFFCFRLFYLFRLGYKINLLLCDLCRTICYLIFAHLILSNNIILLFHTSHLLNVQCSPVHGHLSYQTHTISSSLKRNHIQVIEWCVDEGAEITDTKTVVVVKVRTMKFHRPKKNENSIINKNKLKYDETQRAKTNRPKDN